MIALIAPFLVACGAAILVAALVPVRRLMAQLPHGAVRNRWHALRMLIVLFCLGYLGYIAAFWNLQHHLLDLIVPVVFLCGGIFVWLVATLSLQTTTDMMRVSVLEREVLIDPLTGAFNRRYLERRLSEEVIRAKRYGFVLSVFLLDIDHFKQVNDRYGHQVGDRVLAGTTGIVGEMLRGSDFVARYGGEEFLVVAPHTDIKGALTLAERVRVRIATHEFGWHGGGEGERAIGVKVSIGVASLGDEVDDAEKLIAAAVRGLCKGRESRRKRVVCAG